MGNPSATRGEGAESDAAAPARNGVDGLRPLRDRRPAERSISAETLGRLPAFAEVIVDDRLSWMLPLSCGHFAHHLLHRLEHLYIQVSSRRRGRNDLAKFPPLISVQDSLGPLAGAIADPL